MIEIIGGELYQWDTGRSVHVTDSGASHVHFANQGDSKAVVMALTGPTVKVPDYLFQTGKQLCVYAVNNGVTVEKKVFPVSKRERPEYYSYDEDERNFIYEMIQAAEDATAEAERVAKELLAAKENGEFDGPQGEKGDTGPQGEKGDTGPQGPQGEKGDTPTLTEIGAAPAGYGLGEDVPKVTEDIESVAKSGFIRWYNNTTDAIPYGWYYGLFIDYAGEAGMLFLTQYDGTRSVIRRRYNNGWGEWSYFDTSAFAPAGYGYGGTMYYSGTDDEAMLEAEFDSILATMPDRSAKQITVNSSVFNSYMGLCMIYKANTSYATVTHYCQTPSGVAISCKTKFNGVWSPVEYENPPMQLGVEYRTTERCNGKPVYTKMVCIGTLPNATQKQFEYESTGYMIPIRSTCNITNLATGSTSTLPLIGSNLHHVTGNTIYVHTQEDLSMYTGYVQVWYLKELVV